jgi:predicted kinase
MKPTLYLIRGVCGAGKSTFAKDSSSLQVLSIGYLRPMNTF